MWLLFISLSFGWLWDDTKLFVYIHWIEWLDGKIWWPSALDDSLKLLCNVQQVDVLPWFAHELQTDWYTLRSGLSLRTEPSWKWLAGLFSATYVSI